MKKEIYMDATNKCLVIDGKKYRFAYEKKPAYKGHIGNGVFKEVEDNYEEQLERISKKLARKTPQLTVQMIIKEALRLNTTRELDKIEKKLMEKKKPKIQKGCVGLDIDGVNVPIVL